jgi:hypothetical protein
LKPEPGAFTAVVLGVIGGIANLSTYIGMGFYTFSKKRILERCMCLCDEGGGTSL